MSGGGRLRVLLGVPGDPDDAVPAISALADDGAVELVVSEAADAAWTAALTRPMPRPADRAWREEERAGVQRVHPQVYASVAADRARV